MFRRIKVGCFSFQKSRKQGKNKSREIGAALVEFGIVVPVFVILFVGVTELGRAFWARSSFDADSYWATRAGASVSPSVRQSTIQNTFTQLHGITNTPKNLIATANFSPMLSNAGLVVGAGTAAMNVVTKSSALTLHSSYASRDLMPPEIDSDLKKFDNSGYYDCNGVKLASPQPGQLCPPIIISDPGWGGVVICSGSQVGWNFGPCIGGPGGPRPQVPLAPQINQPSFNYNW